jgi:hypothetical protein
VIELWKALERSGPCLSVAGYTALKNTTVGLIRRTEVRMASNKAQTTKQAQFPVVRKDYPRLL